MKATLKKGAFAVKLNTPLSDNDLDFVFDNKPGKINSTVLKNLLYQKYRGNIIRMWHMYECLYHEGNVVEGNEWIDKLKGTLKDFFTVDDFWRYVNYSLNYTDHVNEADGKRKGHYYALLESHEHYKETGEFDLTIGDKEKAKELKLKSLDEWTDEENKKFEAMRKRLYDRFKNLDYNNYFRLRKWHMVDYHYKIEELYEG